MSTKDANEVEPLPTWAGRARHDREWQSLVGEVAADGEDTGPADPGSTSIFGDDRAAMMASRVEQDYVVVDKRSSTRRVFVVLLAVVALSVAAGLLAGYVYTAV
ncbi:MAG: hypothetical protein GY724_04050 [Actinomycetia bacterium]|nr:hypothetical protein [Actinomycetes bacterium]MCP4223286.1 hypothetical protein [Actinomycetes bacterium]MCP5033122.1 hypothetical protein [Actinomycetes bacterium]